MTPNKVSKPGAAIETYKAEVDPKVAAAVSRNLKATPEPPPKIISVETPRELIEAGLKLMREQKAKQEAEEADRKRTRFYTARQIFKRFVARYQDRKKSETLLPVLIITALLLASGCTHKIAVERVDHPGKAIFDEMSNDPRLKGVFRGGGSYGDHYRMELGLTEYMPRRQDVEAIAQEYRDKARSQGIACKIDVMTVADVVSETRNMMETTDYLRREMLMVLKANGKTEADFPTDQPTTSSREPGIYIVGKDGGERFISTESGVCVEIGGGREIIVPPDAITQRIQ